MTLGQSWARDFLVTQDDLDFITSLLLDRETPLTTQALTAELVEHRLELEAAQVNEQYRGVRVFNPADSYEQGQRILFPALEEAIGTVEAVRPGNNSSYGEYEVIKVKVAGASREFAAHYPNHPLVATNPELLTLPGANSFTAEEVLAESEPELRARLEEALREEEELVSVAGLWFPRSLMLDLNEGHLNLAEAVLDIAGGGPLETTEVLDQIGGLGNSPRELQIFSMNDALNQDHRFDEVGPAGRVFWFLRRAEPPEVLTTPVQLRYTPAPYEPDLLSPEMRALELEIRDEWSDLASTVAPGEEVSITLLYPHRRAGTLPLNSDMQRVFPTARSTPRIALTLIDGQDREQFPGWVVRQDRYVYGLTAMYRKHHLPVGATMMVRPGDAPGAVVVDFHAHRPRTEYVPIITPKDGRIGFEYEKRPIGAEYDDQMILGADDVAAVDALFEAAQQHRRPLPVIVSQLMNELSRSTPQGTVHAKTLYSAVNVLRRTPPGPVLAALADSADYEHVGNNHWRISAHI
ncbi:MAG TPA: hypothetical protein VER79_01045 [Candidatus Limnocylindrales bacterium]|nr:hypothetical protein [Candidatus Limnocylindrales bacterium]